MCSATPRASRGGKRQRVRWRGILMTVFWIVPVQSLKQKARSFFPLNNVLSSLTSHPERHERGRKGGDPNHRVPLIGGIRLFWTLTIKGSAFPNYMNYVKSLRIALPPQDSLHFRSLHKSSHGESDAKCLIQILLGRGVPTSLLQLASCLGWDHSTWFWCGRLSDLQH